MKKKKSIITLLFSILILPVMLIFTACGASQLDTKATCDTRGTYQAAATADELNETIGEQEDFESDGYRMSCVVNVTNQGGSKIDVSFNAIYKNNEIAVKMKVPDIWGSITSNKLKYTTAYAYFKGGYIYTSISGEKIKYQAEIEDLFDLNSNFQYVAQYANVSEILNLVKENANITVAREGNNFKVNLNNLNVMQTYSDALLYLNFNAQNILSALELQLNMTTSSMNMEAKMTMNQFNGNIEFPDLSSYRLVNN